MRETGQTRNPRGGSAMVEFALSMVFLFPLMLGGAAYGVNLSRSIQTVQVCRSAGHLYARSVDFSDAANQNVLVRLTEGMNMTRTGGDGVILLTTVTYVTQAECTAAGISPSNCRNANQHVIVHRVTVGNATLRASAFGTPAPSLIDAQGRVSNYLTDVSARANGFGTVLTLAAGEIAYLAEVHFRSSEYDLFGYHLGGAASVRLIF